MIFCPLFLFAANSFTCPVCNIKLDSVEMYHAHMQGNKHQIK